MKKILKLAFVDFAINWGPWPDPVKFFVDTLSDEYDVQVVFLDFQRGWPVGRLKGSYYQGEPPDLVIRSHPGEDHKIFEHYRCPKIFFSGEPCELNFDNYDYAMTYHFSDDPRHYRLPLYALYGDVNRLMAPRVYDPTWAQREFCCVLFGKPYPYEQTPREEFFRELCKYKRVHSAGRHLNNTGFVITPQQKAEYIKNFKFVLSFESCCESGFTTEKIYEPLLVNSIPIYWGNSRIDLDFDRRGFMNCTHVLFDTAIEYIKAIDQSPELYRDVVMAPRYASPFVDKQNIVNFFKKVLNDA